MSTPAEQLAIDPNAAPIPEGEVSDEELFEQAFNERYDGNEATPPEDVPVDPPPDARQAVDGKPEVTPPAEEGEPPAPAPEGEPAAQAAEPQLPEWYESLPDEAKAVFDKTNGDLTALQQQYTALHGRLAPVQQENAKFRERLEEIGSRPVAQPGDVPSAPAPSAPDTPTPKLDLADVPEFAEFKEAFPEEAAAMEAIFGRQAQHISHLNTQLGSVSEGLQQIQTASFGRERDAALDKLSTAHPDWMQVRPSADFASWLGTQPPNVAQMADSPMAEECIYVLDRYKQDVYLQRRLDQDAGIGDPNPALQTQPGSTAPPAVRDSRNMRRTAASLDPQATDVGVPAGTPEQFQSEEEIWSQEVERRLRAQRDSRA